MEMFFDTIYSYEYIEFTNLIIHKIQDAAQKQSRFKFYNTWNNKANRPLISFLRADQRKKELGILRFHKKRLKQLLTPFITLFGKCNRLVLILRIPNQVLLKQAISDLPIDPFPRPIICTSIHTSPIREYSEIQ